MKRAIKLLVAAVALLGAFGLGWLAALSGLGQAVPAASLSERESSFAERMRDVVLIGHFTVEGQERQDGLPERYEIAGVSKLDGDRWRFDVRLQYGDVDATLPVAVPMLWAGDTPMVSLTDFAIPGLGEGFGARVVFYGDRYAGTWDHGEIGGMMYGTIAPRSGEPPPSSGETPAPRSP